MSTQVKARPKDSFQALEVLTSNVAEQVKVGIPIQDEATATWWADRLSEVKGILRRVKSSLDALVAPLLEEEKRHRSYHRPLQHTLETAKDRCETTLRAWEQERQRRSEEARHLQEEAQRKVHETGKPVPMPPQAFAPAPIQSSQGGTEVRKIWKWRLLDLGQVPRQYLAVDSAAVTEAVRKGAREIPGIEIYHDVSFAG